MCYGLVDVSIIQKQGRCTHGSSGTEGQRMLPNEHGRESLSEPKWRAKMPSPCKNVEEPCLPVAYGGIYNNYIFPNLKFGINYFQL
jgi:hypothetical protein